MHKRSRQGFTLMEMLIVVAIIAVLVAIAIPTFSSSLHKAREAADLANARAYYAYLQADYMTTGEYQPQFKANAEENISSTITYLDGTTVKIKLSGGTEATMTIENDNAMSADPKDFGIDGFDQIDFALY